MKPIQHCTKCGYLVGEVGETLCQTCWLEDRHLGILKNTFAQFGELAADEVAKLRADVEYIRTSEREPSFESSARILARRIHPASVASYVKCLR